MKHTIIIIIKTPVADPEVLKMLGGVKVSLFAQRKAGGGGILGPSVGPYI